MRIYEIKQTKTGRIIGYARSFDQAKAIVKEDDYVARKVSTAGLDCLFSNGMNVHALEVKVDKEGIITLLNNLISQPEPVEKPTEQVIERDWAGRAITAPPVKQVVEPVNEKDLKVETVVPAIAYKVDDLNFPKKGTGTCLHCKKKVGFVGGFPHVNPPEAIQDK